MIIELVKNGELKEVEKVIKRATLQTMALYYPKCSLEYVIESLSGENLKKRASWTHFYVAKVDDKIVGCGAIGPYWGSETESSLFNIFVDPDYQGRGIGKGIVKALENDEFAIRAKRIEIPASMTGIPFYRKLGYEFKNEELLYEDGHFKLEKFFDR